MSKSIASVLFIAFFMRLTLLTLNLSGVKIPESGKDDQRFETLAWQWLHLKNDESQAFTESGAGVFIKCGSAIYSIFGRAPAIWGLILVLMGTGTVYNIYRATNLLWNDKSQAIRVAWFAAFFPELTTLSAVLLREVVIHFFLSMAVVSLIRFWKYKHKASIVYFIIFVGLCTLFHTAMLMVLGGFGMGVFLISQDGKNKSPVYKIIAIFLVIGMLVVVNSTGFGLSKFGGSFDGAFEKFETQESQDALGTAAYPDWLKIRDGVVDTWKVPIRFIAFFWAPAVPFMVKTAAHMAGIVDALFYMLMFYSFYRNRKAIKANKTAYLILVIALAVGLIYSLGVSNFGAGIRHRAKTLPLLLPLAVSFKALEKKRRKQLRAKMRQVAEIAI